MPLHHLLKTWCVKLISTVLLGLRPLLGPATCRFPVSCTSFALQTLHTYPLHKAVIIIIQRLLCCIGIRLY